MPSSGQEQGSLCISADHGATRERLDDHNLAIHESISDYQSAYQSDQGFGNRDHEQDAPHHGFPLSPPAPTLGAVQPYSASSSELGARDQIHPSMDGEETSSVLPSAQPIASLVPASTDTAMSPAFSRGPAETTCQHVPSTCILDSILVDFYRQQRKFVQEGAALLTVLGPSRPFVAAIVRPGSQSNHHPICRVIEDVMSTFGQIPAPEKLGIVFKMHATLRVSLLLRT